MMYSLNATQVSLQRKIAIVCLILLLSFLTILTFGERDSSFLYDKIDDGVRVASELLLPKTAAASELMASTGAGGIKVEMGNSGDLVITGEGTDMFADGNARAGWNTLFEKYRGIIIGISGFATLTMLAAFIFFFAKLGTTAGNEKERRGAITAILFTGIATALLGSVTIIMGFFYNIFA